MIKLLKLFVNIIIGLWQAAIRKIWRPSEKSIHGEIALITGAGHGMGRLFALRFASLGAKVVLVDVNESANLETAEMIRETHATAFSYTCNLRNKDNVKSLAKQVKKDVGEVTMLVNNAGVVFVTDFMSLTDEMISTTFDVNILAHFWLIREFLPDMKDKNHGHIIAMSSISGRHGSPHFVDYSSSKHAVVGLMSALRRELRWQGKSGIKTTCACPSFVRTGFVQNPRTSSSLLCPVLDPKKVVDEIMHAILTEEPEIDIPSAFAGSLINALFPDVVKELIFDYINPNVDHIQHDSSD